MERKQASERNKILEYIFYSNYFYGLCAVTLSIEASLQQRIPLNGFLYFFLVFITTVLYYSYPYVRACSVISNNLRTNWYTRHYGLMRWNQVVCMIILLLSTILFITHYTKELVSMPLHHWVLIFIFPLVAAFYYGVNFLSGKFNLRKLGCAKPFIIGFTWAGMVTIYPVLYYDSIHQLRFKTDWISVLLFLKNFMFISVLCIMFDIKDYAGDYLSRLSTFVVKIGLRKTLFKILLPLSFLGLASFICYGSLHHFSTGKLVLNIIPFILLIIVSISLKKRKPLLYYLAVIDGLMVAKSVCGIIAMQYFS
ncbi:MAG TPA: hypothetical protein VF487_02720 [Chitinophagaceae bacterium]